MSTDIGARNSKDFVEHLRTVHFSLMALCTSLIVLSLAHPAGTIEKALKQIREIEKTCDLRSESDSSWVGEWAANEVQQASTAMKAKGATLADLPSAGRGISEQYSCRTEEGVRTYEIDGEWALIPSSELYGEVFDPAFVRSRQPNEGAVIETSALGLQKDMRLDDFKRVWNFLHHHVDVVLPKSLGSKLFIWNGKKTDWDQYECGNHVAQETPIYDDLQLGFLRDLTRWRKLAGRVADESPRYGYTSSDETVFIALDEFDSIDFDGQGWFLTKNPKWKPGKFADSFPELDEASAGMSNQNLDTVEHALANAPKDKAEGFEAFGIKIPGEVLVRFGILLILSVQVYFLVHLVELSIRMNPDDPGWDVAWVGVYSHRFARFIYLFTALVLPLISVLALGQQGLSQSSYSLASWSIACLGLCGSVLLAYWIWKKTPLRPNNEISEREMEKRT